MHRLTFLAACLSCLYDWDETRKVLYVIGHPGAIEEGDLMDDVLYVNVSAHGPYIDSLLLCAGHESQLC